MHKSKPSVMTSAVRDPPNDTAERDVRRRCAERGRIHCCRATNWPFTEVTKWSSLSPALRSVLMLNRRPSDVLLLSHVRLTAPAHLRRRASAQPVVNDAGQAQVDAMSRAVELPHTLHPFTTGCMWKMFARRRRVQTGIRRPDSTKPIQVHERSYDSAKHRQQKCGPQ